MTASYNDRPPALQRHLSPELALLLRRQHETRQREFLLNRALDRLDHDVDVRFDDCHIDVAICVPKYIPKPAKCMPTDIGIGNLQGRIPFRPLVFQSRYRLGRDQEIVQNSIREVRISANGIKSDRLDDRLHTFNPLQRIRERLVGAMFGRAQNAATISVKIRSCFGDLKPPRECRSTGRPNAATSASSISSISGVPTLCPGMSSTSTSTSLSAPSSPRATEPNTAAWTTPKDRSQLSRSRIARRHRARTGEAGLVMMMLT